MNDKVVEWIDELLAEGLEPKAIEWSRAARSEIARGVSDLRFANLISAASRHARRRPIETDDARLASAGERLEGWNPERWTWLDALRVGLVLARGDLEEESGPAALLEAFRFADVGELCALYRALPLLPRPADYLWQAGEGCRSNMTEVFEAVACDSPYPARHFDEVAWRALVVKALFVGAPLWRVQGLDDRLSEELCRMALDLADERRSAGRPVPPELWLCSGRFGGERAIESLERELASGPTPGRRAAARGLARAGRESHLEELVRTERDPAVAESMRQALAGNNSQQVFQDFVPEG